MNIFRKFFVSLKTAIFLLTVISLLSMLGTMVPQGREARDYLMLYPQIGHWILAMGADDMFHSQIFTFFLGLLAISTLLCTVTRFSLTRKRLFERLRRAGISEIRSFPVRQEYDQGSLQPPTGGNWQKKEQEDGGCLFFRVNGRLSLFGGLFIHVGLLLILAGGLIDAQYGVETVIRGMPGERVPVPAIEGVRSAAASDRIRRQARRLQFENPNHPQLEVLRARIEGLDAEYQQALLNPAFRVVFEDLWVENHQGPGSKTMGAVKSWNSKVSFHEDGKLMAGTVLRVNEPYSYGSYTFYQADWQKKYRDIHLSVWPGVGSEALTAASPAFTLVASLGVPIRPEWSSSTFVLNDFWPDFKMMGDRFVSLSEDLNNPAGRLVAYDADGKQIGRAWAFTRQMNELAGHVSNLPYVFLVEGAEAVFESGIQVVHNPGAPLVWAGCLLFTLGMGLAFYVGYIEEWVIQRADGRLTLAIAGNRHHTILRGVLETLRQELQAAVAPPIGGSMEKENPT